MPNISQKKQFETKIDKDIHVANTESARATIRGVLEKVREGANAGVTLPIIAARLKDSFDDVRPLSDDLIVKVLREELAGTRSARDGAGSAHA